MTISKSTPWFLILPNVAITSKLFIYDFRFCIKVCKDIKKIRPDNILSFFTRYKYLPYPTRQRLSVRGYQAIVSFTSSIRFLVACNTLNVHFSIRIDSLSFGIF